MYTDTICFLCKPTRIMYSSAGLNDKMCSIHNNGINISRVIVAVNVGCDDNGTHTMYLMRNNREYIGLC